MLKVPIDQMRLRIDYISWKLRNSFIYSLVKSCYYRNKSYDVYSYDSPINPFKTVFVDPGQINRFTGRPLPLWRNKENHIGEVRGGDWDRNSDLIIEEDYDHEERRWLYELIFSGRYDETVFHRSFAQHFEHNVKWEETEFIKKNIQKIEDGHRGWKSSESKQELLNSCEEMDHIFQKIRNQRYKKQGELKDASTLLERKLNEVVVDIGRKGDLLLVDNRHRLSMAKILNLEQIPVCFLTRHEEWMETRDSVYHSEIQRKHPDFSEFKNT